MPNESRDASGEQGDDAIPSSVFFAAARDVLLDWFSDARVDGLKLRRSQAEMISAEICDLGVRRYQASLSAFGAFVEFLQTYFISNLARMMGRRG